VKLSVKSGVSDFMKHHTALACKLLETIIETSSAMYKPLLINVLNSLYCTSFTKARKVVESVLVAMPNFAEISEELPLPIKIPYLQPTNREYSLILDLDETLVHYVDNGTESRLNVRPGCNEFLVEVSKYYEVVIFTAALQDYADWAIDTIDLQKSVTSRLYRQHTVSTGPVFIKDLSRLGRDLSKVIIIDNVAENFRLQPGNGLFIKS
jgi:TFIIF-interacting CTD phosphatases, including NLI-interacting factor